MSNYQATYAEQRWRKTSEVFNNIFGGIVTRIIWSIWPKDHVLKLPKSGKIGLSDSLLGQRGFNWMVP